VQLDYLPATKKNIIEKMKKYIIKNNKKQIKKIKIRLREPFYSSYSLWKKECHKL
jgi:hypothetical protein